MCGGRCGKVWRGVKEGKGRCGKCGDRCRKCVGMRGKMWESAWGEREEVCWGVGELGKVKGDVGRSLGMWGKVRGDVRGVKKRMGRCRRVYGVSVKGGEVC